MSGVGVFSQVSPFEHVSVLRKCGDYAFDCAHMTVSDRLLGPSSGSRVGAPGDHELLWEFVVTRSS